MRYLRVTFGNIAVVIRVEKGGVLRVTVNGKDYMVSREGVAPTFTEPPDDLSEELQAKIFWAVDHYFMRKK